MGDYLIIGLIYPNERLSQHRLPEEGLPVYIFLIFFIHFYLYWLGLGSLQFSWPSQSKHEQICRTSRNVYTSIKGICILAKFELITHDLNQQQFLFLSSRQVQSTSSEYRQSISSNVPSKGLAKSDQIGSMSRDH